MSKLKAIAVDKLNITPNITFVFQRAENNVGKGENAGYQHFLLFSQYLDFFFFFFFRVAKSRDCEVMGYSFFFFSHQNDL